MLDWFPLVGGRVLRYRTRGADGEGRLTVECLRVEKHPAGKALGRMRATVEWPGRPRSSREYSVVKDPQGFRDDEGLECPFPPELGRRWSRYPNEYRVESQDALVECPAGRFERCLKVVYLIAGGDAGIGERYYAPGIGFVRELCSDESDPFEHLLEAIDP